MSIRHTRYVHDYYTARIDYVPKPIHIKPKFFSVPLVNNFGNPPSLTIHTYSQQLEPTYLPKQIGRAHV